MAPAQGAAVWGLEFWIVLLGPNANSHQLSTLVAFRETSLEVAEGGAAGVLAARTDLKVQCWGHLLCRGS